MLSERVYRRLLAVYPKEHRQEYGELMVQLFRDRMRRDGGGFRKMTVWTQMILDLTVSAFKEHKEETDMKKRRGRTDSPTRSSRPSKRASSLKRLRMK